MNRTYGSGLKPGYSGLATPLKEGIAYEVM